MVTETDSGPVPHSEGSLVGRQARHRAVNDDAGDMSCDAGAWDRCLTQT